ncbi:MAG: hypothetical protein NVS9B11_18750 [Candidatus Dormibacteraceae bacterium]
MKSLLPGCDPAIVQTPVTVRVTVLPKTVHEPAPVKVTGSPEEAVAATVNGASPRIFSPSGAKLMV